MKSNIAQSQETFAQRSAKKELFAELGVDEIGENLLNEYAEYGAPDSSGAKHNLLALPFLKEATKYGLKLFRTKTNENKWSEVVLDETSPTGTTLIPCNNQ